MLLLLAAADPTGDPALLWRAAQALGVTAADADLAEVDGLLTIGSRVTFRHPRAQARGGVGAAAAFFEYAAKLTVDRSLRAQRAPNIWSARSMRRW